MYRQRKRVALNVGIAGDVANFFMVWWDRQLKRKLEDDGMKVKMYSRYADGINIFYEKLDAKVEREADDETTKKWIQKIANNIHNRIQATSD